MTFSRKYAIGVCFALLSFFAYGQNDEMAPKTAEKSAEISSIEESTRNMSLGDQNAIAVRLPHEDAKTAEKLLDTYLQNHNGSRSKKVRKSNEKKSEGVILSEISSDPVDVYHEVVEMGEGSVVYLWVDVGGTMLSSEDNPEVFEGMQGVIDGYQKDLRVSNIEDELEAENDMIADLQKEHDKQTKAIEKWKKEIEDCKLTLSANESSMPNEEKEVEAMKQKVSDQETVFRTASTDASKKAEKKELKSLEKQLRKLENTLKKHQKETQSCQELIPENEASIQNAESNLEALLKNIEDHKQLAEEIQTKLAKAKA